MSDLIPPEHLQITTFADNPNERRGGQQVGVPSRGVQITHIPTGITAYTNVGRSQVKNRNICLVMLEAALTDPESGLQAWALPKPEDSPPGNG